MKITYVMSCSVCNKNISVLKFKKHCKTHLRKKKDQCLRNNNINKNIINDFTKKIEALSQKIKEYQDEIDSIENEIEESNRIIEEIENN